LAGIKAREKAKFKDGSQSPVGRKGSSPSVKDAEEDGGPPLSFEELINRLSYPINPAYMNPIKAVTNTMKQSFVDLCREKLIPFSKADALLYKLQGQKDTFDIFSVLFNQTVDNSGASPEARDLIERICKRANETDKSEEELKE